MWILFTVISMATSATRRIYDKNLTGHFRNIYLMFIMNIFGFIPFTLLLFIFPIPKDVFHLGWSFWWPVLASCIVQFPLQMLFYLKAIKQGEMSSVMPLLALSPVFNVFSSMLLVREFPSHFGYLGIILTACGVFLLLYKKGTHIKSRPEFYMLLSVFFLAIGSSFDKVGIGAATPIWYGFVNYVVSIIVSGIYVLVSKQHGDYKHTHLHFKKLVIVGILFAVSYATLEIALSLGPTAYVLALRSGVFVLTSLWGIYKLKESVTNKKIIALILFILGTFFLAFA